MRFKKSKSVPKYIHLNNARDLYKPLLTILYKYQERVSPLPLVCNPVKSMNSEQVATLTIGSIPSMENLWSDTIK